jgi:protein-S-isoprenylcysteine O-methyltransferase Ste14
MLWLRAALVAALFVGTTLVLIPRWIRDATGRPPLATGLLFTIGLVMLALGAALMLWGWAEFATRGRGTPAPVDPPRRLVVRGPYRYVRNPLYVAAVLVLLGQAALYASPALAAYAAVFWVASHLFVVGYEERGLARRFGPDYQAYRAAVPRWVPRRPPLGAAREDAGAGGQAASGASRSDERT